MVNKKDETSYNSTLWSRNKTLILFVLGLHAAIFLLVWVMTFAISSYPKHWLGWVVRFIFPEAFGLATFIGVKEPTYYG